MRIAFQRRGLKNAFVYSAALCILLVISSSPGSGFDQALIRNYMAVALIVVAYHLFRERSNNWLRPDILFLIGFIIVHYQWPLMILTSGLSSGSSRLAESIGLHGNYGTWISTIALVSWLIGFAITKPKQITKFEIFSNVRQFTMAAIALLLVFALSVG